MRVMTHVERPALVELSESEVMDVLEAVQAVRVDDVPSTGSVHVMRDDRGDVLRFCVMHDGEDYTAADALNIGATWMRAAVEAMRAQNGGAS